MADTTLPMDIIATEILPRLPVKSLLRFKCVSKFFQTLISTPEFVHSHLRHSLSSDDSRLLILRNSGVYSVHLDSPEFPTFELCFPSKIDKGFCGYGPFAVGSCNGLVCIGTSFSSLVLFNPSTGIYRQIYCNDIPRSYSNFGFGFDDINDDYKIVRVSFSSMYDDYGKERRDVEVYSLKSGSWSTVESAASPDTMFPIAKCAVIDNHLVHWEWWNRSKAKRRFFCFDLCNNQWGEDVPLPVCDPESGPADLLHVKVLDGCLCLWTKHIEGVGVDVWVMKEYGVKDSWVKLASISCSGVIDPIFMNSPLAYGKGSRSEILVRVDPLSRLLWYNIRNKTWRVAEIHGVPVSNESNDACLCKGSLVSIPGGVRFQIQTLIKNQGQEGITNKERDSNFRFLKGVGV